MPDSAPVLTAEEIQAETFKRLAKYDGRNLLEQFALFMGLAQILEIELKQLAGRRFGLDVEALERTTLGQLAGLLRRHGLRPDFLMLLDSVVEHRNHVAHELLANQSILATFELRIARFETTVLERALYELEQLCFLFEWTEQHDQWGAGAA